MPSATIMRNPCTEDDFKEQRHALVAAQVAGRGIRSPLVLDAMRKVPREAFVPEYLRDSAYQDSPLPIGCGQTISQPHVVAYMIDELGLSGGEKVLEIGAGSGYAAAVLAEIADKVYTIERIAVLAEGARAALAELGYGNVELRHGDGTHGWPEQAPFDAITVAAGARHVPEALKRQLRIGGSLVIPVGRTTHLQQLVRITRLSADRFEQEDLVPVRFVPLIGDTEKA